MRLRLVMLLLLGVLLTGCVGQTTDETQEGSNQIENAEDTGAETVGETETEMEPYILTFEAVTTDGETLTSECFGESKLTMINVWATYCNPCLSEMPDLGEIANAYDKAEFQMLGIVSDVMEGDDTELIEQAKELIEQTNADYPHLLLNESLYMNLVGASNSVPTTYFFNQKGELLGYLVGAQSKETWESIIHDLLAEMA